MKGRSLVCRAEEIENGLYPKGEDIDFNKMTG
jgi:hypothetical protein